MPTRAGQQQTRVARQAAKLAAAKRRAEKRQAAKERRAAEREAAMAAEKARRTADREAERMRHAAEKAASRRSVGRPRKPPKRPARWTDYHPSHARRIYRAILHGHCYADPESIAAFFGVCAKTVGNWRARHPNFARAIDRAIEDRARIRYAAASCRRVDADLSKIDETAKTPAKRFRNVVVRRWCDMDRLRKLHTEGHFKPHMRRRWRELPAPPAHELQRLPAWRRERVIEWHTRPAAWRMALLAVECGALSGRAIAKFMRVSEAALRLWRKQTPRFEAELSEAIERERERREALAAEAQLLSVPGARQARNHDDDAELLASGVVND